MRLGARTWLLATALLTATAGLCAQVQSVDTSRPIIIKSPKPKPGKFLGEVISSNSASMIVRDRRDYRLVRTFSYTPEVHAKMMEIISRGGYRYGDKVEVDYANGSDVALNIKGKPSSPKHR